MKKENSEHNGLVEVTTDYTEPKKSAKVLHAVAGVAGAAAVLTGAVFGLKFLNDHGGLKEGGSDELRAGYHEETTAAATMPKETVVTEQPEDEETVKSEYNFTCAPSGIDPNHFAETDVTYEFDDYSAHISGYNYDGLVLKVKYELTYKDEDIVNDPIPTSPNFYDRELMNLWNHGDMGLGARYISRNENVIEMESECLNLSVQDSFDTVLVNTREFWDNNKDLSAEEINTEFAKLAETHEKDFTAYRTVPDIPVIVRDLAEELPTFEFSDGTTVHPTKLYLSAYGVFVYFDWIDAAAWQKILPNMQPARITLTMSDGSVVTISSGNGHGTRHDGNMSGRDYVGGLFDEPIDTRNVVSVNILDEPFVTFEKETSISVQFQDIKAPGEYKLLYYIDDEIQPDLTETIELSETKELVWNIKGSGIHTYKLLVKCLANQAFGELYECTIDFTKPEPEKDFDAFNAKTFKELAEHENGDVSLIEGIYAPGEEPYETEQTAATEEAGNDAQLPEFPIAISNGNGLYGEYLDTPLTGDEAWELVKERGGIDYDYPFPYDKSIFKFTGTEFCIDYADFDVTALVGGTVEFAGFYQGWGNTVLIHDENGHYWLYGHLAKDLNIAQGDTVEAGVKLGHTGSTGVTDHQRYALRVG
ncbi:MAG: M23 family metallopeptidase [Ruminiclostridium sp.]|nr:M23 family metallopeptidase [Ruminiclostridium sp.]